MHTNTLAGWGRRALLLPVAALLVLVLPAQSAQASSVMGLANNSWIIYDLASEASSAATAAGGLSSGTARLGLPGTADGPPLGVPGTYDGPPGRVSGPSKSGTKVGRAKGWAGLLATGAQLLIPWALDEGTSPTYADLPAGGPTDCETPFPCAWQTPAYSVEASRGQITYVSSAQVPGQPTGITDSVYTVTYQALDGSGTAGYQVRKGCQDDLASWMTELSNGGSGGSHTISIRSRLNAASNGPRCPVGKDVAAMFPYNSNTTSHPNSSTLPANAFYLNGYSPPGYAPGETPVTTTSTTTCSNGATFSTVNQWTANGAKTPFEMPVCPAGTLRTSLAQTSVTADGRTVASPLGDWTRPTVPSGYTECLSAPCQVLLVQLTPGFAGTPDSNEHVCNNATGCEDALDPVLSPRTGSKVKVATKTGTGQTVDPATWAGTEQRAKGANGREYECRYGPYRVPLMECELVPHMAPSAEDEGENYCELSDFSMNPVSWVVVPLKCLFIPRDQAVQDAATALSNAWDGTAPAVITDAMGDVAAPVVALKDDTGPSSCNGPPFTIPQLPTMDTPLTIHPLSTCNELTTYLLGIYMPVASALVYIGGFFTGTRIVLKVFGLEEPGGSPA